MGTYYCVYHDQYHDSDSEKPDEEHIISKSLGGSDDLTIKVCKKSNNDFGSDIDKPLGDLPIIAFTRHRLRLIGHSGKEPDLEFHGQVELGGIARRATWTISSLSPDRDNFRFYPIIEKKEEGETTHYTIRCAPEDEKNLFDTITRKEAKRGRRAVTPGLRAEGTQLNPEFIMRLEHSQNKLRQGFAKIALAFGYYILGEEFSRLPDVNHIRKFIWERDPAKIAATRLHGYFWPNNSAVQLEETCGMPDQHFLALHNTGMLAFTGLLFGKYGCVLRFSEDTSRFTKIIPPLEGRCVWINPVNRKMQSASMLEYLSQVRAYRTAVDRS